MTAPFKLPVRWAIGLALLVLTLGVFWRTGGHEFILLDDTLYVTKNLRTQAGLNWQNLLWAFTTYDASNWHPLTWLSHMADCQFFGLNPSGHHLVNVVFHAANSFLLFLVLSQMTGADYPSAFVAALFAVHPLHVESVAWVAERKDVLSTFFWFLTMGAYAGYVKRQNFFRYFLVMLTLALGLMVKPMLVTLPFALLLLDYWPLKRQGKSFSTLLIEKIPLIGLALLSTLITFQAQTKAITPFQELPLARRLANALMSYLAYLVKTFWPQKLAIFYPYAENIRPLEEIVLAFLLLAGITAAVGIGARRFRYLPVGWLWYLGTLVPVIGLVQIGEQAMADRYTYLPLIGIFMIIAWGVPELLKGWRYHVPVLSVSVVLVIFVLSGMTWRQLSYWENDYKLLLHTVNVTPKTNYFAYQKLAEALDQRGRKEEAAQLYEAVVQINPRLVQAHNNLGVKRAREGKYEEAIEHFKKALPANPNPEEVQTNLGNAYGALGKLEEAVKHYNEALRIKPDFAEAHNNLGVLLAKQGKLNEAYGHYQEALRINPNYDEARSNLTALQNQGVRQ